MYRGFFYVRASNRNGTYHSRRFISLREAIDHAVALVEVFPYVQVGGYSESPPHNWESLGGVIDVGFIADDVPNDEEEQEV